jgi:hypothetical protein
LVEWLWQFWATLDWSQILIGVGLFLVSLIISSLAVGIVLVKIPAAYFSATHSREFLPNSPFLVRWGALIAKNVLGVFLILLGIVLSLPGVPGQGILTILLGLIMIDIPGKRPFEARIVSYPKILAAINRLRERYKKPPLILD